MKKEKKSSEKKEVSQEQKSKIDKFSSENKILKVFLIAIVLIFVVIFLIAFFSNRANNLEYRGVDFKKVKFCDNGPCLITYNTKLPVIFEGKKMNYNFYLRNNPKELENKVKFEGDFVMKDKMRMNITFDRSCQGYESVAVNNFANLYTIAGVNISVNGTCDLSGKEMYVELKESNETKIEKIGPACYRINIKKCEIIDGMERFMTETFVKINENLL